MWSYGEEQGWHGAQEKRINEKKEETTNKLLVYILFFTNKFVLLTLQ